MEKLAKKYKNLVKIHRGLAVATEKYREALINKHIDVEITEFIRDSLIKRFELTYDLLWKYLREYMIEMHSISIDSPRKVFQECLSLGIIHKQEAADLVDLLEDRNLTTHVYDVELANQVAADIQKHQDVIGTIIKKVSLDSLEK